MKNEWIKIDKNLFEHILNCLANQKFLHEQSQEVQNQWQNVIDTAWKTGMAILRDNSNYEHHTEENFDEDKPKKNEDLNNLYEFYSYLLCKAGLPFCLIDSIPSKELKKLIESSLPLQRQYEKWLEGNSK